MYNNIIITYFTFEELIFKFWFDFINWTEKNIGNYLTGFPFEASDNNYVKLDLCSNKHVSTYMSQHTLENLSLKIRKSN